MDRPGLFLFIFGLIKQTIQFKQQINVKNVMPIQFYSVGIWTRNLLTASLILYPKDLLILSMKIWKIA